MIHSDAVTTRSIFVQIPELESDVLGIYWAKKSAHQSQWEIDNYTNSTNKLLGMG